MKKIKKYSLKDIKNDLREAGLNPLDWSKEELKKMQDRANKDNK